MLKEELEFMFRKIIMLVVLILILMEHAQREHFL